MDKFSEFKMPLLGDTTRFILRSYNVIFWQKYFRKSVYFSEHSLTRPEERNYSISNIL